MARYFAPGEHLTYDDYLSLRQELLAEIDTYIDERFNLSARLDDLEERATETEVITETTTNRVTGLENWLTEIDRDMSA